MKRTRHFLAALACLMFFGSFSQTTDGDGRNWTTNANWVGGSYPGSLTVNAGDDDLDFGATLTVSVDHYMIVGTSTSDRIDMNFNGTSNSPGSITVEDNDTLIVFGDVFFANKSMELIIGNNSVLIIMGDASFGNNVTLNTSGTLAVSGDFSKTGSQGSFTGTGAVYAGSYSGTHTDAFIPGTTGDPGDQQQLIGELSDDGFTEIEEFINGGGSEPLPVELTSFSHTAGNTGTLLKWETASELNNDYFIVQRSENGTDFYELGMVDGNGTTSEVQNYSFMDRSPIAGIEYYRLKQVDFDGAFEIHSPIVAHNTRFNAEISVEAYPNPAAEKISLKSIRPLEFTELVLVDISGKVVANLKESLSGAGLKMESPLPALESGLYHVRYKTVDGRVGIQKLFIR